ncbi:hypothetical protein BCO71033_01737 [Burkholderia contaminans]|uniref:Uncharacterized protein n=1 Tax=Burkholderia contaminans TaxID=488447 RepID=A0A6P2WUD8_9BURK|nr:hypothetical protein BCO71033_01737 [Burkholderia contaminans]
MNLWNGNFGPLLGHRIEGVQTSVVRQQCLPGSIADDLKVGQAALTPIRCGGDIADYNLLAAEVQFEATGFQEFLAFLIPLVVDHNRSQR